MATPSWLAATSGQPTQAGQVNQFLGTHNATIVFTGATQAQQTTAGSGSVSSLGTYIAQSFQTTGAQTTIGRVSLTLSKTGTPPPITLSIQANNSGAPSGTPLVTTLLPQDFLGTSSANFSIPIPITGLTPSTTYWIVLNAQGTSGNIFSWFKSNQTSGCSTSTNGTSWSAQTFGLLYQVVDNSAVIPFAHTWEDSGVRWTILGYNVSGQLVTVAEYNQGQTATGYLLSVRSLSYTNGILSSVA